jgi:hypothetical protein
MEHILHSLSLGSPRSLRKHSANLVCAAARARRVHDVRDLKSIEAARGAARVRAHLREPEPVADGERGGQRRGGRNAVDTITRRAPHAASALCGRWRDVEGAAERENVRDRVLMVEEDAVEGTVDAIVDVV